MSAITKVGESRKPNLLQISEEDLARAATPDASITIETNESNLPQKILKKELNFHELWAQSHWRQFTSITPGLVLLFASGTQIYWTIHELLYNADAERYVTVFIWYLGAILGSIVGAYLVQNLWKRSIYYIGAVLLVASSFFFIKSNVGYNIYFGRLLTGILHGIIQLVLLVHGCDNASKRTRASILRTVAYVLVFGTLFAIITNISYIRNELTSNRCIGVYLLGFAIFTVVLTPTATNESVPHLIALGKEDEALQKYVQLRSERIPTTITLSGFNEVKTFVLAEAALDKSLFTDGNWKPLLLITIARLLSILIINIPLLICLIRMNANNTDVEWSQALIWLQCIRILFGFLPILYCSALTRNKALYKLGFVFGFALCLLSVSIIYSKDLSLFQIMRNTFAMGTLFCYAGSALGLDAVQHVQSAEAFAMVKKPQSLAFLSTIEHLAHIILIVIFLQFSGLAYSMANNALFCLICSIILIIFSIYLHFKMPISSGLSFSDACYKYKT